LKNLKTRSVQQTYKEPSFRESRDENNQLTYLNVEQAMKVIKGMPVYNVLTGKEELF
jgi:hypothetical protein